MCLWIRSLAKTKTIFKKILKTSWVTLNRSCFGVFSRQWGHPGGNAELKKEYKVKLELALLLPPKEKGHREGSLDRATFI